MKKIELARNHDDLCKLAVIWLKRPFSAKGHGCAVAMSEVKSGWGGGEIPDAIGFRANGYMDGTVVVEVKVTRPDFLSDKNKSHRQEGGLGNWRYYMAPAGLIKPYELPEKWGLLEVNARGHIKVVCGPVVDGNGSIGRYGEVLPNWRHESNSKGEQYILVRALANTGDPQKTLNMLRESNRLRDRIMRENEKLREKVSNLQRQRFKDGVANRALESVITKGGIVKPLAIPEELLD